MTENTMVALKIMNIKILIWKIQIAIKKVYSKDYCEDVNNEGMDMKYVNEVNDNGDYLNKKVTNFKFINDSNKWSVIDKKLRLFKT